MMDEDEIFRTFLKLIDSAIGILSKDVSGIKSLLSRQRLDKDLETHVLLTLNGLSHEGDFQFSALKAHSFPDIVAEHSSGARYGLEIKTAKKWTSKGNSVNESTGDKSIKKIIILYCKTSDPIEFRCGLYQDFVEKIDATHYPRYSLNMNLKDRENFFDKINLSYEDFRKLPTKKKVKVLKDYYVDINEDKWWIIDNEKE